MANCRCTKTPPNISGAIKHQIGTICPETRNKTIRKHMPIVKSKETCERYHLIKKPRFCFSSSAKQFPWEIKGTFCNKGWWCENRHSFGCQLPGLGDNYTFCRLKLPSSISQSYETISKAAWLYSILKSFPKMGILQKYLLSFRTYSQTVLNF